MVIASVLRLFAMRRDAPHRAIHPLAVIEEGARLGDSVEIGPYCHVGAQAVLGDGVRLLSHVVVTGATDIGAETVVYPFACLGAPPQHLAHRGERTGLSIGARNVIREHVTLHAGTVAGGGLTRMGDDNLLMVGSHVGHDCIVGSNVILCNNVALAGHVQLGDFVYMGGLSAVHQHSRIGRHAFVGGLAAATRDVIPFGMAWGNHARLEGLNLVGLRRRGFPRQAIARLHAGYRQLFAGHGTLHERLEATARAFAGSAEMMEIVGFIRAQAKRPLCLPD